MWAIPFVKRNLSGKFDGLKKIYLFILCYFFCWQSCVWAVNYPVYIGDPEFSEQGAAVRAFKKYVEEKTHGQITFSLFYASQLADEAEAFRNVQSGAMPFAIGTIANLAPFDKRLAILTFPYLFNTEEEAIAGTSGNAAKLLEQYALEAGFRILCWTCTDFRYISNSRKPIRTMADIKGLKFRVPQSAVFIATYRALGASPAPISWGETFTALQQGVVDGQCYGFIGFLSMKFLDAKQKFLTETHYTYQIQPLVMSEKFYRTLPREIQLIFIEAGLHAREEALEYLRENSLKARQKLESEGLQIFQLEDEEQWQEKVYQEVWPKMANYVGGWPAICRFFNAMEKPLPTALHKVLKNGEYCIGKEN